MIDAGKEDKAVEAGEAILLTAVAFNFRNCRKEQGAMKRLWILPPWSGGPGVKARGSVSTESRALGKPIPTRFFSRYGEKAGAPNPEELLGSSSRRLFHHVVRQTTSAWANLSCRSRSTAKSEVVIDKDGDGFSITSVHLPPSPRRYRASTRAAFQSIAAKGKRPIAPCLQTE